MIIRKYETTDCEEIAELFYNTVHSINAKDYTKEQLDVWETDKIDLKKLNKSLLQNYSIVVIDKDTIIGFGDIDKTGYIAHLFVHKEYQKKGVATAICNKLEQSIQGKIFTHSSITAKPFFQKRGYLVIKKQEVELQGIYLTNFVMEKYK